MPRPCSICAHPLLADINQKLVVQKLNVDAVSQYFQVSKQALYRHSRAHLGRGAAPQHRVLATAPAESVPAPTAMQLYEPVAERGPPLDRAQAALGHVMKIVGDAGDRGDARTALLGLREARGYLELCARLMGELKDAAMIQVNLVQSPEFAKVSVAITDALLDFPEARQRVLAALARVK
jgi:hypothetical protein